MRLLALAFVLLATFTAQPARAQTSDVIVVLGGSWGVREREAARLYAEGVAPRVLISGSGDSLTFAYGVLLEAGVPADVVTINDTATNTYDEALGNLRILADMGASNVTLVTHDYHMPRALCTYEDVAARDGYAVTFAAHEVASDVSASEQAHEDVGMLWYRLAYGVCG